MVFDGIRSMDKIELVDDYDLRSFFLPATMGTCYLLLPPLTYICALKFWECEFRMLMTRQALVF
jgi:hypothetical protein